MAVSDQSKLAMREAISPRQPSQSKDCSGQTVSAFIELKGKLMCRRLRKKRQELVLDQRLHLSPRIGLHSILDAALRGVGDLKARISNTKGHRFGQVKHMYQGKVIAVDMIGRRA
ncbi:hypothetical protein [Caballeronia sp. AZ1_KS37]|uniref:hypothetical protein n=1 Tax=Caballeronia sp. AZ1_KS37 TaxID=2921756 RepID=UPI0020290623|nr:hypothetical protein [Caballeronia sp. AZ1_KS37]